ncbi:MAG: nucleotide exchange factor GrpE [Muribaculaceae bacterium]|nr:nucleotide exchange factor GrpE [Muribaculaceae bacterium]
MSKNKKNNFRSDTDNEEQQVNDEILEQDGSKAEESSETGDVIDDVIDEPENEIEALKNLLQKKEEEIEKEKKDYLFLMADFDNFRKRTLKEKSEIIRNGSENVLKGLLPIVDDFERGLEASKTSDDSSAVKEGMELIYNKFIKFLEQNGVKVMETNGQEFDPDRHEAITTLPVDDEEKKNKIVDTVSKGYTLNDKVLRHAKVVVGN